MNELRACLGDLDSTAFNQIIRFLLQRFLFDRSDAILLAMARATKSLSRHRVDLIARMVVSGRRGYGKGVDGVADSIAGLMKNRLEAAGAPGATRACKSRRAPSVVHDDEILKLLLSRVEKHLASLVLVESKDDRSQAR